MNSYTPDGLTRYLKTPSGGSPNNFCTGDVNNGTANISGVTTSYDLRNPTDTYNPKITTPVSGCVRQYQPYYAAASGAKTGTFSGVSNTTLDSTKTATYNDDLAKVYHQWVKLCTFTPSKAGDYYLQIRTNVALGGAADGEGGYKDNPKVYSQTGDDTAVDGQRQQPVRDPRDRLGPRLRLDRRLPGHVDLRQLQRRQHDVQPGARDPGCGDQDPQHRLLRRGRREQPRHRPGAAARSR